VPSVLENPTIRSRVHLWTIDEYHRIVNSGQIEQNLELIHGVTIQKMSKSPRHANAIRIIQRFLENLVSADRWVSIEQPITIGNSEPEPDISIIRGRAEDFQAAHPDTAECIIEIAASSLDYDLEKAEIYASAAIPQYYIIDLDSRKIHIFTAPQNGLYAAHEISEFKQIAIGTLGEVDIAALLKL
jgi:Uma2 family endonuclease